MSSVAENIIQHATHNSTLHQLAKDQPSVGVTTAFSILDTLKSMSYLKIFATLICILLVWDQVAYQIRKVPSQVQSLSSGPSSVHFWNP